MKATIFYNNSLEYAPDEFEINSKEEFIDMIKDAAMPGTSGFVILVDKYRRTNLINTRFIQTVVFSE